MKTHVVYFGKFEFHIFYWGKHVHDSYGIPNDSEQLKNSTGIEENFSEMKEVHLMEVVIIETQLILLKGMRDTYRTL